MRTESEKRFHQRIAEENREHKAKVEAYFAKIFAPLTPEEQVFFNGECWLVFDPNLKRDQAFADKDSALVFANGLC